ncbi:decaprenyl-phosphate phosphoribosyltransferase [Pseudomonas sp. Gutcm_11s]|uniref:decaprenyl-phosphate phosphoribosyltransferase n=1 Tax=Pseudomonas sp. Gutcm_11s TaxID=3026088 RepID=UPI00235ECBDB|nr:decaprenyl-phosphate phosphoribosyltransferase [Pseudomonas sp. Gutcm_11s]MDD0844996.1 decaprenyl-phosphate phosphoribosyltransferase [Pseudomonas sp. Gutcm_11s]
MHANAAPRSTLARLQGLFVLLRPRQWVKNVFVLAPLLFTGQFIHSGAIVDSLFAMAIFCLASSACYIVNDLHDIERDRRHPKKSLSRPLASGLVPIPLALAALALLYLLLILSWWSFPRVLPVIAGYLLINLAYTFVLKHQPVIDIFTVATGFVLRVYAGAMALNVPVSAWMFVTTLCLALYLAAVKRRQELASHGGGSREVLDHYTPALIDRYAEMAATGALLFYSLFVMQTRPELVLTIPLVLFGLYRYWFIVEARDEGESPTDALLGDWQLQVTVLIWCAACAHALWPN